MNSHKQDDIRIQAVARMQARQRAWAQEARSRSSESDSHSESSGMGSPLHQLTPMDKAIGGSSSSTKKKEKGEKEKRRKVAKACLACQKSHLTCDEKRPCTRCVKKGVGDQCQEGVRKKAKYLLEEEEKDRKANAEASSSSQPPPLETQLPPNPFPIASSSMNPMDLDLNVRAPSDNIWLSQSLAEQPVVDDFDLSKYFAPQALGDTQQFQFGNAASSEYQMLDAMLNSMSPVFPGLDLSTDPNLSLPDQSYSNTFSNPYIPPLPQNGLQQPQNQSFNLNDPNLFPNAPTLGNGLDHSLISPSWPQPQAQPHQPPSVSSNGVGHTPDTSTNMDNPASLSPWQSWNSAAGMPLSPPGALSRSTTKARTAAEAYHGVFQPYDYTEGYHFLMEYLAKDFDRRETLKVVKALATFRPSLIALQMPLSEEDEIFLERSFQRTLVELEKLISYSATPTAVWRRTGEVVYANPEFCALVNQTGADLLGGKTYIYMLFTKPSVVSYWENFSVHAFENTTQNFFNPTTLAVKGKETPCSCCFTIRRDVFDLPSVVIGQFLPIPQ